MVPALLTAAVALAVAFQMLKRKSTSQSVCILNAVQLQNALKSPLEKLLALNRRARILRAKREAAERGLKLALLSKNPPAIAAAKALQTAVTLQQTELSLAQHRWLAEAERLRQQQTRQSREIALRKGLGPAGTRRFFPLALAVRSRPASSLSPDYTPVPGFALRQQQRFSYFTDLAPEFFRERLRLPFRQKTECSATLAEKGDLWTVRILAGNAWLN